MVVLTLGLAYFCENEVNGKLNNSSMEGAKSFIIFVEVDNDQT